jgi:hypothetical protein
MVRASRRTLVPNQTPDALLANRAAGRELRAQIGSQKLRVPGSILLAYYGSHLRKIEAAQKKADPLTAVLFTGIKQSLNLLIPVLREFIKRKAPELPPLPDRPRHTDPIVFLLGYMYGFGIDAVTQGEWIIPVDETGLATGIDWTYAEEYGKQLEARRDAAPPLGEPEEEGDS